MIPTPDFQPPPRPVSRPPGGVKHPADALTGLEAHHVDPWDGTGALQDAADVRAAYERLRRSLPSDVDAALVRLSDLMRAEKAAVAEQDAAYLALQREAWDSLRVLADEAMQRHGWDWPEGGFEIDWEGGLRAPADDLLDLLPAARLSPLDLWNVVLRLHHAAVETPKPNVSVALWHRLVSPTPDGYGVSDTLAVNSLFQAHRVYERAEAVRNLARGSGATIAGAAALSNDLRAGVDLTALRLGDPGLGTGKEGSAGPLRPYLALALQLHPGLGHRSRGKWKEIAKAWEETCRKHPEGKEYLERLPEERRPSGLGDDSMRDHLDAALEIVGKSGA